MYTSQTQRKQLYQVKKHKDLGFLLDLPQQKLNDFIIKYPITNGKGSSIHELALTYTIYYSYQKYDYTGKSNNKVTRKSINFPFSLINTNNTKQDSQPNNTSKQQRYISMCLNTMKLHQKSWFNIIFDSESSSTQNYNGYHYEIFIDQIMIKNENSFRAKQTIYLENKQKGKEAFMKKQYKLAVKCYKTSINILTGLSKKLFTAEEIKILGEYAEISQCNYLKCVAKMNGIGHRFDKQIAQKTKSLIQKYLKKYPTKPQTYYQKAAFLKYDCKFSDAQQVIKQGLSQATFSQNPQQQQKQKQSLKNMLSQIKKNKQRNIRHLKREEIRKLKLEKRNNQNWDNSEEEDDIL